MALIFIEGFDTYGSTSDLAMNGWTVPSSAYSAVPGRFGVPGRAMPAVGITKNLPNNYTTFYMGFAVNGGFTVTFFNVAGYQFYVQTNSSSIQVYRNNYPSAAVLIGQSLTNVVPSSGWFFVEIGATVDAAAGSVTVRINGNTVLSLTNVDTQGITGSTANDIVSGIEFTGSSDIDDLYFCDTTTGPGTYPCNTFLGDKRVRTVFPSSNAATQFTPVGSVAAGQSATGKGGNYYTLGANHLILSCDVANPLSNVPETGSYGIDNPVSGVAPRMAQDATITSILLYAQTNYPAMKIRPVIAAIDPVALTPSQILYVGDEKIGLSAGQNTLTFTNVTASVYKDTDYALGFITDTSFAFDYFSEYTGVTPLAQTYSITYVSPPSTPASTLPVPASSLPSTYLDIGYTYTVTNYAAVSEDGVDQDQSYNVSGTAGAVDLYGTNAGLPSGATVYGVQVCGVYRKDDAGSRSVANLIKSGTTQAAGATRSIGTSYQYYADMFATNPATGASWAVSDVNALEIGCEVVS